jgi:hypothetical protein
VPATSTYQGSPVTSWTSGASLVVEVAQPVGYRDRGGLGVAGQVGQLGAAVGRQRHDRDDADPEARHREDDELPPVGQLDHDAVTGRQSEVEQAGRRRVGPAGELGMGEARAVGGVHQRDGVRRALGDVA